MLEQSSYCPILHTRQSELRALLQLPAATKDRLFPLMVARPWPNAVHLEKTWEKIHEALGDRRFGLDLDQSKRGSPGRQPAAADFDRLFDPAGGYQVFYDLVATLPRAIPVLQSGEIDTQLNNVEALDRGCILRVQSGTNLKRDVLGRILSTLDDVVFVVDAGWSKDLLNAEAWASAIVSNISLVRPEAEIVISGSSFPDEFTSIGARGTRPVRERALFQNLARRHNAASLVYGDWGSTRPPREPTPMKNVPRLDLPKYAEWIHFRRSPDTDEDEDYQEIAQRVVSDPEFSNQPNIWGTYAISCTAANLPGAIRSASLAASARINIHLHNQTFYGETGTIDDQDEPFTDD